jgi:hypothetical protein
MKTNRNLPTSPLISQRFAAREALVAAVFAETASVAGGDAAKGRGCGFGARCESCEKANVRCVGYDPLTKQEVPRSYVAFLESCLRRRHLLQAETLRKGGAAGSGFGCVGLGVGFCDAETPTNPNLPRKHTKPTPQHQKLNENQQKPPNLGVSALCGIGI